MAHWLFWQKKTTGLLLTPAKTKRLVDVALAGRAVAEVGDDGGVAVVVAGADAAVALDAHRVAGGVQGLGADDDRVEVEVLLVRVPAAVVDAAEHAEQVDRVDAAAPGDAVLAVGGEGVVLRAQRAAGADLRGLLAEQAGPEAELALALQRGGLGVEAPDEDQVAVEPAQLLVASARRRRRRTRGAATRSPSGVSSWTISGPPSWTGRSGASARETWWSTPNAVSSGATSLSLTGHSFSGLPW